MTREIPEWIGRSDDERVPARVKLRVFEAYGGRCYLSGRKIMAGDKWEVEHKLAIILGGENRESNLAPALVGPHKLKTKVDLALKSKIARVKAKHLGVWPKPARPLQGRGFAPSRTAASVRRMTPQDR